MAERIVNQTLLACLDAPSELCYSFPEHPAVGHHTENASFIQMQFSWPILCSGLNEVLKFDS